MITVITGPMYAEKSKYLIEKYNEIEEKEKIKCFKPSKDKRTKTKIRSRALKQEIEANVIEKFEDIMNYIDDNIKYIFIDEVQFLNGNFNILEKLSIERDIDIYIAGLSKTDKQHPFGKMPYVLALADKINVLTAKCKCGKEARYTICKIKKDKEVLIDTGKEYQSVCRECYNKLGGKINE